MEDRSGLEGLLFPVVEPGKWAELYGLELKDTECVNCGEMISTDIPVACEGWRGLLAHSHSCGPRYRTGVWTKATKEGREEMRAWFRTLSEVLK